MRGSDPSGSRPHPPRKLSHRVADGGWGRGGLKPTRSETLNHCSVIQRKVAVPSVWLPHPSNSHVNAGLRLHVSFCIKHCVFGRCCAQDWGIKARRDRLLPQRPYTSLSHEGTLQSPCLLLPGLHMTLPVHRGRTSAHIHLTRPARTGPQYPVPSPQTPSRRCPSLHLGSEVQLPWGYRESAAAWVRSVGPP